MMLDASTVTTFVLLDLTLILGAARLVGGLFVRVRQPRVVGEILAGVLLGPTLFGPTLWPGFRPPAFLGCDRALAGSDLLASPTTCLFPPQAVGVLGVIGQIALLLFMFLVGLQFDPSQVRGRLRGIVLMAVSVVAVPVAAAFAVQPVLATSTFQAPGTSVVGFSLFVGAMMAVTALPVMVRILQEKGLATSVMGATGVAAAALTTVLMFLLASAATSVATGAGAGPLAASIGGALVLLVAAFTLGRRLLVPLGQSMACDGVTPTALAAVFGTLFVSGLLAHMLGVSVIVGGFVAGLILPARDVLRTELTARLGDLTAAILLPVFLAYSGLATDFTQLRPAALPGIALFVLAGVVAKWGGGAVAARVGGLSWAEGNLLGVLLNCRGLLVLVVALAGVQTGVITPVMQLGGVLMALVTTAMTGPLFDRFALVDVEPLAPAFVPAPAPVEP